MHVAIAQAARWLLYASLLVPLIVFPGFLFPFVTIRAVYFRVLVELGAAIFLYLVVRRDLTPHFRRDAILWGLVAWIGANALSAAFGPAFMRSIFGDHERMGGVWFWLHLLAYYILLRTFLRPDDWWRFFRVSVGVAAGIAAYGLMQYWFHPFNLPVGGVDAGVTIGNPGLFAPYLLANIALAALLAARAGGRARTGYLAIALLLTVALVFTGNRSSTLALVVGAGIASVFYVTRTHSVRSWRAVAAIALLASAGALPFVTRASWARPVTSRIPALGRLSSGVDSTRVIQWRAAVEGIRARPLLGVGPENYQIIWSEYQSPEMHRFIADSRWDRAHNAYLDAFATAGLLGFLSLLAVWIALGWSAMKAARQSAERPASAGIASRHGAADAIAAGFFAAYAFYLFFWFFDLNSTMLWIALAAFVASRASGTALIEFGAVREKRWQSTLVLAFGAVALASVLYVHGFETLRMARTLDHARDPNRPLHEVLADYESVFSSPAPVTQHAFLMYAGRLRDLYPRFQEIRLDPTQAELFDRAFVLAITEFERQARQDPLNERVLVQHARVLMLGAYYYGNMRLYESALDKLRRAVALSPRRVNTYLVLGVAYLNAKRPEQALQVFQRAYAVYPPFGQTHSYLAEAYSELGKPDSAAAWLRSALEHGYIPGHALVRDVSRELATAGSPRAAAYLVMDYLRTQLGPTFMWARVGRSSWDHALAATTAADLFDAAGDSARAGAIRASAPALCSRPVPLRSLAGRPSRLTWAGPVPDCRQPWRSGEALEP